VVFREVNDEVWKIIRPYFLPQKVKTGRPRSDLHNSFNGILYVLITGIPVAC
jgi:hypothetical protein